MEHLLQRSNGVDAPALNVQIQGVAAQRNHLPNISVFSDCLNCPKVMFGCRRSCSGRLNGLVQPLTERVVLYRPHCEPTFYANRVINTSNSHCCIPLLLPVLNVNSVSFTLMSSHCFYICFNFFSIRTPVSAALCCLCVLLAHYFFTSVIGVCILVSQINLID